ncbi:MAG TPA: sigma-70 family RNA polymerase sigma factor [Gemmataceae bacterium]|nr:sigma-70 family RNA polymerase sigma factor [Gemmataceae bacterium]
MNPTKAISAVLRPRRTMMAVVLGTALSTLGGSSEAASSDTLSDLSRYCTACWRNARLPADLWSDCTQEVFIRLLERVPMNAWERSLADEGDERREFLRAIDAVKKRVQRAKKCVPCADDQVADGRDAGDRERAEEMDAVLAAAREQLSDRQHQIVRRTLEGWTVPDIARELNTSPERVSDEKYKAIRKLRASFADAAA